MAAATLLPTLGPALTARAQQFQQVSLGDAPDGGPSYPEFIVAPGQLGGFFALASVYAGQYVILYDVVRVQYVGGFGSPAGRFIRAHEYGHHRNDHAIVMMQAGANPFAATYFYAENELEADCWAADTLMAEGDPQAVEAGIWLYSNSLPPHSFPGMPGAIQRVHNIHRCISP
jgi:hypothetical protein